MTVVREHHGRERAERGEKDDMGVWPFFWEANNYKIVVDAEGTAATIRARATSAKSTATHAHFSLETMD